MVGDIHALNVRRARRLVGKTLRDKWHLDSLLGVGGMAAVFAATHRNGSRAAVKILHQGVEQDPNTRRRFLREGYVANKVDHPGVPSVIDDDVTEDGRVFLVMELLEGESLDVRLERKGPMPEDEVLHVADQVLDVLQAAHEKGIVHRDLKPDNFYIAADGSVKVLDFGIARLHELATRGTAATQLGDLMGTLEFMPPEQAQGQWDQVDAQSDLWALGAAMHTMLTGRPVHTADTVQEMLAIIAAEEAPPLGRVLPGAHPKVAAVVDRALAFQKRHRWPNAEAMRAAVGEAFVAVTGYPIDHAPSLSTSMDEAETLALPHPAPSAGAELFDEPTAVVGDRSGDDLPGAPPPAASVPPPPPSDTITKQFVRPREPPRDPAHAPTMHAAPPGTTWMASALSVPGPVRRAVRLFWVGAAAVVLMVGAALVLLRKAPEAPTGDAPPEVRATPPLAAADELEAAAREDAPPEPSAAANPAPSASPAASAAAAMESPAVGSSAPPPRWTPPAASAPPQGQFLPKLVPSPSASR